MITYDYDYVVYDSYVRSSTPVAQTTVQYDEYDGVKNNV